MTKEAAEQMIGEYVKVAETLLKQEYGDDYTADTIEKLASELISIDQEAANNAEIAMIRQHAFTDELSKIAGKAGVLESGMKSVSNWGKKLMGGGVDKLEARVGKMTKAQGKTTKGKNLLGQLTAEKDSVRKTRIYTGVGAAGAIGAGALGASMSGNDK